jgi:hypothetical protein
MVESGVLQPLFDAATRATVGETWQERMANEVVQADGYLSSRRCLERGRVQARSLESEHSVWRPRWRMWLMSLLEERTHLGS